MTLLRNVLDAAVPQQTGALPPDAPRWQALAVSASEALRFPALCANSVTVAAWWLALVPLLYSYQKTREAKRAFMEWNLSPFLLNVHALNLPLAAAAHLLSPRRLARADLWAGLALSYAYLLFYLRRLDARGLHFYIILSPRTRWAPAVYAATADGIALPPPVFTAAVEAASKSQEKELAAALLQLVREDPSLRVHYDDETDQLLLSGMGELHLPVFFLFIFTAPSPCMFLFLCFLFC